MKPHYKYNWQEEKWEEVIKIRVDLSPLDYNLWVTNPETGKSKSLDYLFWNPKTDEWG